VSNCVCDSNELPLEKTGSIHMLSLAGKETLTLTLSVDSSTGSGDTVTVAPVTPITLKIEFALA
jgi:hypothetical protein